MQKIFVILFLILTAAACKDDGKNKVVEEVVAKGIVKTTWKNKTRLNANTKAVLEKWIEFNVLESSFEPLYAVENTEDLTLVLDNIIESLKLFSKSTYPKDFDKPQVKSRERVLTTMLLKTKGHIEYGLDVDEVVGELIYAHNAFLNQFNVLINNEIPQEILDNV